MTFVELSTRDITIIIKRDTKMCGKDHTFIMFEKERYQTLLIFISSKTWPHGKHFESDICSFVIRYFLDINKTRLIKSQIKNTL